MQDPREKIRHFIRESFLFGGDDELRDDDSFLEMGIVDSTGVLELVAFLESEWGTCRSMTPNSCRKIWTRSTISSVFSTANELPRSVDHRIQPCNWKRCSNAVPSGFPDKTALVCGPRRMTYAEYDVASNRLAHALIACGVSRGDRVAIMLDNSIEIAVSVFAILKAGAAFMMVNATTKAEKLHYLMNHSGAAALIASSRRASSLEDALQDTPDLRTVVLAPTSRPCGIPAEKQIVGFEDLLDRHERNVEAPRQRAIDVDLASVMYTSGSTGVPKGVMLTHQNMVTSSTTLTTYFGNTADDVILNALPLSFNYGLYHILMAAQFGGTLVIERTFAYPEAVLKTMVAEGVTAFPIVPTMLAILLQADLERHDLSRLRYMTNTGAALPSEHIARLRAMLPQVTSPLHVRAD